MTPADAAVIAANLAKVGCARNIRRPKPFAGPDGAVGRRDVLNVVVTVSSPDGEVSGVNITIMPANVYNVNMTPSTPPGETIGSHARYHHGNLAAALIDAGYDLAAEGGPNAVTVREAARRVGVSAPAAYRHFADRDEFLGAVAARCRRELALSMIAARDRHRAPQHRFEAVGRGYIEFAMRNPHLIDTAFAEIPDKGGPTTIDPGPEDPNAFMVLVGALDDLAAAGLLPAERREGAEIVAWSAVHGISLLLARSPGMRAGADEMVRRVLDGIVAALGLPPKRR